MFQHHLASYQLLLLLLLKFSNFLGFYCGKNTDVSKIWEAWRTSLAFFKPSHTKVTSPSFIALVPTQQNFYWEGVIFPQSFWEQRIVPAWIVLNKAIQPNRQKISNCFYCKKRFYCKMLAGFCFNTGKHFFIEVPF